MRPLLGCQFQQLDKCNYVLISFHAPSNRRAIGSAPDVMAITKRAFSAAIGFLAGAIIPWTKHCPNFKLAESRWIPFETGMAGHPLQTDSARSSNQTCEGVVSNFLKISQPLWTRHCPGGRVEPPTGDGAGAPPSSPWVRRLF